MSLRRALAGVMLLTITGLLSCRTAPPQPIAADSEESAGDAVAVLWWPADATLDALSFSTRIAQCLTDAIRDALPQTTVIPHRRVRDLLFPLLEPGTQPGSEAEFGLLIQRADVHDRLKREGIRNLVAFTGNTDSGDWEGGILCGAGYGGGGCLGFSWAHKSTRLEAALWDLQINGKRGGFAAEERGTSLMPALVLPVPLIASTEGAACRELAERVVAALVTQR